MEESKKLDKVYSKCQQILTIIKDDPEYDDVRADIQKFTRDILQKAKKYI